MADPEIGRTEPIAVEVEEGKMYWWCTCGRSESQPFCDGSHKDTDFIPQGWEAPKTGKVFLCACKRTAKGPFCDGAHNNL
ncbi:MAG: CDGSH iron-sulfur domain-containing protein [Henriciella sp.]|nr:CDGSH iron-sulfur domain-containing protein [Henriciella sp.]